MRCDPLLAVTLLLAAACGPRDQARGPTPPDAAQAARAALDATERAWTARRDDPGAVEATLRAFLAEHGEDARAGEQRARLARVLLDATRLDEAEALAREAQASASTEPDRDHAAVVEAAALRRRGEAARALALLQPLAGKLIATDWLQLHYDELLEATLAAGAWSEARALLLAAETRATTSPEERALYDATRARRLQALPSRELEALAAALAGQVESDSSHALREAAWEELALRARAAKSARLARRLLDLEGGSAAARDPAVRAELERLAGLDERGLAVATLPARRLGLLLETETRLSRERSAAAVAGMVAVVGPSLGDESHEAEPGARSQDESTHAASAAEREVTLVTRALGEGERPSDALRALAAAGAPLLIAGMTAASAAEAFEFAEHEGVDVLLLTWPTGATSERVASARHAFVLASEPSAERERLRAVLGLDPSGPKPDALDSEGCGEAYARPGRTRAVLVLGAESCARSVMTGLAATAIVGLGLEAGLAATDDARTPRPAGVRLAAGSFPHGLTTAHGGAPSWYEALSHDAALLGRAALAAALPSAGATSGAQAAFRAAVATELARAEALLWTTDARGFGGGHALARQLHAVTWSAEP